MRLDRRPSVGVYFIGEIDPTKIGCKDFRVVSTYSIIALTMRALSLRVENFSDFSYDEALLLSGDHGEVTRVNREISIRRKWIETFLKLNFSQLGSSTELGDTDNNYFELLEKMPVLCKIISNSVSPFLEEEDFILYGVPLKLKFPISYVIETEDFSKALIEARRRRQKFETIHNEQLNLRVKRSDFEWKFNDWLIPIRELFQEWIMAEVQHYRSFSEFDLAIQLLMHLGARKVQDLRNKENEGLNIGLIRTEIKRLAKELDEHFKRLEIDIDGKKIKLPFAKMNGFLENPFGDAGGQRAELDLSQKEYSVGDGETKLIVKEKYSGRKIVFTRVRSEISALYSKAFCNLHYANPGEIAVFGAYLEGDELPFAYSSYGRISYNYTKDMLFYMGYADGEIIESSRAWNAPFAPENTMSVLFTYSQKRLAEEFPNIRGVLTAINPNLGFSASAFRAIHFEIVSLKPTVFSYQLRNGLPYFRSKRDIAEELGISIGELVEGKHYINNQIPFLPTIEMLYLYDKNERKELAKSPIYVVSEEDYINNR